MVINDRITHRGYKENNVMMGHHESPNDNLFLYNIYLKDRVRKDHPLRKITEIIDFSFIYKEVEDTYGTKGNVSVPPPTILKLMLLFIFYNVRSERELMETIPERLDWLWFLGYNLDSSIPDHSVLSKARKRWGAEAFKNFFERVVMQCLHAGLIDGSKIFMDSSLIDADASNNSVVNTGSLKKYLNESYQELEKRLDNAEDKGSASTVAEQEKGSDEPKAQENTTNQEKKRVSLVRAVEERPENETQDKTRNKPRSNVNSTHVSTTDPDASIVRQGGKAHLSYKTHRAVDPLHEVITAVEVTPGAVNEAHKMADLIEHHEKNTDKKVTTVVADSKYGTIDNFLFCHDKGILPHIPFLKKSHEDKGSKKGIFPEDAFTYDPETDTVICPAQKRLKKRTFHKDRQSTEYVASRKDCSLCLLQSRCTKNKLGRTVHRHIHKEKLDAMVAASNTPRARRDIKTRQDLMERSFAHGTRYDFDDARWRGLWKVNIQEYLVAAIQNIQILLRYAQKPIRGVLASPLTAVQKGVGHEKELHMRLFGLCFMRLKQWWRYAPVVSR
jgi:transposase